MASPMIIPLSLDRTVWRLQLPESYKYCGRGPGNGKNTSTYGFSCLGSRRTATAGTGSGVPGLYSSEQESVDVGS